MGVVVTKLIIKLNSQDLETLFTSDYATIQHKADYLLVTWKGYANDADYQACVSKQLELAERLNLYKMVLDAVKFRGTSIESRAFTNEAFNDLANKRGKHILTGLVIGDDVTGRFSINKIVKDSEEEKKYFGHFISVSEAEEWIQTQEVA